MAMGRRNCTLCGGNGHNQRTCIEKGKSIKLFGVEITTSTVAAMSKIGRKIKKGNPWTEDEQIAFLKGLEFHGKGNWAKIAKDFLPSRTSTQIASHAQKHFMRLDANSNERKYRKKSKCFSPSSRKNRGQGTCYCSSGNSSCSKFSFQLQYDESPNSTRSNACYLGLHVSISSVRLNIRQRYYIRQLRLWDFFFF
ncbi:putative transcription factor [Capsicum galapagoense]